jgi:excisionase family DNA binding protein
MSKVELTITEAAKRLSLSTRTIRRHIKSGKIKARLIEGSFGPEYRISDLPLGDNGQERATDRKEEKTFRQNDDNWFDYVKELQEKNLTLAAQLGAASERVRQLESQIKLLTGPKKKPWWRRLFSKKNN